MANPKILALRKKEGRGIFLTIILLMHSLFALNSLYSLTYPLILDTKALTLYKIRSDIDLFVYSISIVTIISVILLWRWSKFGIYGLILIFLLWITIIFLVIKSASEHAVYPAISIVLDYTICLGAAIIYFWAIKRKWHLFS